MARIDLVLFDCDGVLVDSELISMRCLVDALGRVGAPDRCRERAGRGSWACPPRPMCAMLDGGAGRAAAGQASSTTSGALCSTPSRRNWSRSSGITRLIDRLAVTRCVASSSTPERIRHSAAGHGPDRAAGAAYLQRDHGGARQSRRRTCSSMRRGRWASRRRTAWWIEDSVAGVTGGPNRRHDRESASQGGSHLTHAVHGPALTEAGRRLRLPVERRP